MPKIHLTPHFVTHPPKVKNKARIDYFDTEIPGFLLEVRSSGKCTFYQRYRDRYGRLRQLRIGPTDCITLEEARQKAKKIRSQAIMGLDPAENTRKIQKTPTFKEFIHDQYIPFVQIHKRSWEADLKMIENRIMPLWGSKMITEVNREDVEEFRANFIRAGYKPASANRYLALVKYIFNLAVKWEVIDKSPAKDVKKLAENNQTERYLTADETRRLLHELTLCQSREVADIIEFLLFTGARRSEVVNLPWTEIDFETQTWTLPADRNKGKVRKIVPLSQGALKILDRRKNNGSEYVFPNPETGLPLKHFHGTWDKIRKNAGIPDVRIHDIRHNFASIMINNGRSLYEVQKMLGHADFKTTQRYAHLSQETLKDATELVSRSIGGESGKRPK